MARQACFIQFFSGRIVYGQLEDSLLGLKRYIVLACRLQQGSDGPNCIPRGAHGLIEHCAALFWAIGPVLPVLPGVIAVWVPNPTISRAAKRQHEAERICWAALQLLRERHRLYKTKGELLGWFGVLGKGITAVASNIGWL